MIPVEERLNQAQQEVSKLKASLKNYEGLIETYKNQVRGPDLFVFLLPQSYCQSGPELSLLFRFSRYST